MEFYEYYRIMRSRIWLPLALAAFGLLVVLALYFVGGRMWKAEGQMLAQPGAGYLVTWAGSEVNIGEGDDTWGTLEQMVQSQAVAQQGARKAGVDPAKVSGLGFERTRRGNMFKVMGSAPSAETAQKYVAGGMDALAQMWNQTRLERAQAIQKELQKRGEALAPRREALQSRLAQMETGPPPGKPEDVLTWTQAQISQTQGALSTATVDIEMSRDRLSALNDFAQRERSTPPAQRVLTDASLQTTPLNGLQLRLQDLQSQRTQMLQTRTENHPEAQALSRQITSIQQQIAKANEASAPLRTRVSPSLEQQLVLARGELAASERRVTVLREQETRLRERIPELQARVRNYQKLQEQLAPLNEERQKLVANLQTIGGEIKRLQGSADLRVVDAATVTGTTKSPAKLAMMAVGALIGGFVIGLLLVFLLHYLEVGKPETEPVHAPA